MMEKSSQVEAADEPDDDLGRFEVVIGIVALALYVIERCLAFAFLRSRSGSGAGLESQLLEFFFGQPPYSILDILLGFDLPEGMLGLLNPRNILQAVLQAAHFLVSWWIARLPFFLYLKLVNRTKEY